MNQYPWHKLIDLAMTNKIKVKRIGSDSPETEIPLNSDVVLELQIDKAGYLLTIEKGTSGKYWLLSPSSFAPNPNVSTGLSVLPQKESVKQSFRLKGQIGLEQILAIVFPSEPKLDFLPKEIQRPLQIQEENLSSLLNYLNSNEHEAMYAEYMVVNPHKVFTISMQPDR